MIPSIEEIEKYVESIEQLFFASVSAATPDLPHVRDVVYRFWVDVSRYGPSGLPSIHDMRVPQLKDFQIPPPPPPVPPKSPFESSIDWMAKNPWKTSGIVLGVVVGVSLLVGYGASKRRSSRVIRLKAAAARERRQVVVVLGGDHPLGPPLIASLEKQGYIVIVSVSSPDAVDALERSSHGYVRALVLDPTELDTIPIFLRSLSSTLSRRFPLTAAGDPHASPAAHPYIHSVVSLLTIPSSTLHAPAAPLEHLSIRNTYLPYLTATHITPIQVVQALLPLLRTTPARARDANSANGNGGNGKKTIVVCLPAADARVGLPFASVQAMSAAATLRAAQVLRREINAVSLTDKSQSMKNIKVVVVDVGVVSVGEPGSGSVVSGEGASSTTLPAYRAMDDWTASEKLTYGPAFTSILLSPSITVPHASATTPTTPASRWRSFLSIFDGTRPFGIRRKPTDVGVFVNTIVAIVSTGGQRSSLSTFGLGLGSIRSWFRSERFAVGAGATTYRFASRLPSWLLDVILNIPHFLISVRNALLPIPPALPHSSPRASAAAPKPPGASSAPAGAGAGAGTTPAPSTSSSLSISESWADSNRDRPGEHDHSEISSEAEVESGLGEDPPNNSWVSLQKKQDEETPQS